MHRFKSIVALGLLAGTLSISPVATSADRAAGKEKAAACIACHGESGVATAPIYPNLAGQYESYLAQALKSYQSGDRADPVMGAMAAALSEADIANLAAYFAAQEGTLQTAR
ncbi:MAG: c-type cytochrome [Pseudomonadales bacterium]